MSSKLMSFLAIMLFYIFISYVVFPLMFYFFMNKSLKSAGHGFVVGSIISVILWYMYGSKMV